MSNETPDITRASLAVVHGGGTGGGGWAGAVAAAPEKHCTGQSAGAERAGYRAAPATC